MVSAVTLLCLAILWRLGPADPAMMVLPFLGLVLAPFIGAWLGTLIVKDGRDHYVPLIALLALLGLSLAGRLRPTEPLAIWGSSLRMTGAAIVWFVAWVFVFALVGTVPRRINGKGSELVRLLEIVLVVMLVCSGVSR